MSRRYAQIETSKVFSKQHSMLFCLARTVSALYARTATKATVSLTVAARAGGEMNSPCDVNYFRLTQISPWGGFACKRKQFENLTKEMLTSTQPARLHFTAPTLLTPCHFDRSGEISGLPLSRFAQISRLPLEMTMVATDKEYWRHFTAACLPLFHANAVCISHI